MVFSVIFFPALLVKKSAPKTNSRSKFTPVAAAGRITSVALPEIETLALLYAKAFSAAYPAAAEAGAAVRPVRATAALVAITKTLRSFDASDLIKTNPLVVVFMFFEPSGPINPARFAMAKTYASSPILFVITNFLHIARRIFCTQLDECSLGTASACLSFSLDACA